LARKVLTTKIQEFRSVKSKRKD